MLKDIEIGNIAEIGPAGHPPASKYERLIADAKLVRTPTTFVVHPCEETALRGPIEAAEAGIILPILVGPAAKIAGVAREHRLDISRFEIVDVPHSHAAAAKAAELIRASKGELLMKGSLHTDELMREVRMIGTRAPRTIPAASALARNVKFLASMFPASRSGTTRICARPATSDVMP